MMNGRKAENPSNVQASSTSEHLSEEQHFLDDLQLELTEEIEERNWVGNETTAKENRLIATGKEIQSEA